MLTDSKQLLVLTTRASHTAEKMLIIDISAVRETYNTFYISNVGLIAGADNPSDFLTNPNFSKEIMKNLRNAKEETLVLQWIIRAHKGASNSHFKNSTV